MASRIAGAEATTYLLEGSQLAEVVDFVAELGRRGVLVPEPKPALVNADGTRLEVPKPVFEALVQVATAMARAGRDGYAAECVAYHARGSRPARHLAPHHGPAAGRRRAPLRAAGASPPDPAGRPAGLRAGHATGTAGVPGADGTAGQAAGIYEATAGPVPKLRLPLRMATFPAFLGTCALYAAYLCDTLLRLAEARRYRTRSTIARMG